MASKSTKTNKPTNLQKNQQFIQAAKRGKYAAVEASSIAYVRMSNQAQPVEQSQNGHTYFGIR